jgi:WD40 repeat protein
MASTLPTRHDDDHHHDHHHHEQQQLLQQQRLTLFPTAPLPTDSPLLDTHIPNDEGQPKSNATVAAAAAAAAAAVRGGGGGGGGRRGLGMGKQLEDRPVVFHPGRIRSSGYGQQRQSSSLSSSSSSSSSFSSRRPRQPPPSPLGTRQTPPPALLPLDYPLDSGPCIRHRPRLDLLGSGPSLVPLLDLAFTPDGRTLLTAAADGTADAYPLRAAAAARWRKLSQPLPPPKTFVLPSSLHCSPPLPIRQVRPSHSGRHLLTASDDGAARMWSLDQPQAPVLTIHPQHQQQHQQHKALAATGPPVTGASFFWFDQLVLVAAGKTLGLYSYRLERLSQDSLLRHHPTATHPGSSRCVHRWVHDHAQSLTSFDCVYTGALSPMVISAASDRSLSLLDAAVGAFVRTVPDAHDRPIHTVRLPQLHASAATVTRGELETFVTAATDGVLTLWDVRRRMAAVASLQGHHVNRRERVGLAFSPCRRWLAVGSEDHAAYIYDLRCMGHGPVAVYSTRVMHSDGSERPVHADVVSAVAWHPSRPQLLTASFDGTVRMWEPED